MVIENRGVSDYEKRGTAVVCDSECEKALLLTRWQVACENRVDKGIDQGVRLRRGYRVRARLSKKLKGSRKSPAALLQVR